jgi:hypothetical protein
VGIRPRVAVVVFAVAVSVAVAARADAQVFELIDSFRGCTPEGCDDTSDVARPDGPLLLAPDGFFYGATGVDRREGESSPRSWGTIFRIDTAGQRTILRRFSGEGDGGCFNGSITVGDDGALYGLSSRCDFGAAATIFRLIGTSLEVLQTFPPGGFTPQSIYAGPGGAFYGFGITGTGSHVLYKWSGDVTVLGGYEYAFLPDLMRGPDGNLYFQLVFSVGYGISAGIYRLSSGDRIESIHQFGEAVSEGDLIVGSDGRLCGSTRNASAGMLFAVPFCMTTSGVQIPLTGGVGMRLLAVGVDRSRFVVSGSAVHRDIWRLNDAGTLALVHAFAGADGTGAMPRLTRGPDGHLYGVRSEGGAYGEGVLYRIRMPEADIKANGSDGPPALAPGVPLEISIAFDASPTTTIEPAELYVAVVTPSLDVFWMTAAGFSATPARFYSGPLPSFGQIPLLTIPDAGVLPPGDYYWVTIVDADGNGVPNGTFVDVVKTTRVSAAGPPRSEELR